MISLSLLPGTKCRLVTTRTWICHKSQKLKHKSVISRRKKKMKIHKREYKHRTHTRTSGTEERVKCSGCRMAHRHIHMSLMFSLETACTRKRYATKWCISIDSIRECTPIHRYRRCRLLLISHCHVRFCPYVSLLSPSRTTIFIVFFPISSLHSLNV